MKSSGQNLIGALIMLKNDNIKPNFSELERVYGTSRKTIRKYYQQGGLPKKQTRLKGSKLDAFKDEIINKVCVPGITLKSAFEFFKQKYPDEKAFNSVSTFRWYCNYRLNLFKSSKNKIPHPRFETPPGKQLQVDWKEDITLVSKHGEVFKFNLFVSTYGYSRYHQWVYSPTKTTDDFLRCLIDVLNNSGGSPQEVLTDNMSAIVSIQNGKKVKHSIIKAFEKDTGIHIRLTKTRAPETKGKVESGNRYVNWLKPYNYEFENEIELISIIKKVNSKINDEVNQTTHIPPSVLFEKEKETLNPLTNRIVLESYLSNTITQIVPSTCLVRFEGSEYSVPVSLINKRVKLTKINQQLYIYFSTELISIHDLSNQRINYHPEHYSQCLSYHIPHESELLSTVQQNLTLFDSLVKKGNDYD